jgi:hypothetical protein
MRLSFDLFGHDPDPVVHDLEKSTSDCEPIGATSSPDGQCPGSQQRHEWGMIGQDADLAIIGGRDDRIRLTVEHR